MGATLEVNIVRHCFLRGAKDVITRGHVYIETQLADGKK